jgi:predicted metal-dependent hydrolase
MSQRALLYRRPSEPSAINILFEREIYLVRVRRHRQARRYTLRIHSATREVLLTMPPRGNLKEARAFAQKHGGWIAARLGRLPKPAPFVHGTVLPLRGIDHRIVHRRGRGTCWIEIGDDGSRSLCVAGEDVHVARRVHDFLKREAKADLEAASRAAAERLGAKVKRVSIRAAFRARLSRGPRGGPSGRDEPLQTILAAGRPHLSARHPCQDLARRAWH